MAQNRDGQVQADFITAGQQAGLDLVGLNLISQLQLAAKPLLLYRPFIDVRWFGAVGDGTTNDDAALRRAIAAIPSSGGILWFPLGYTFYSSSATGLEIAGISNLMVAGGGTLYMPNVTASTTIFKVTGSATAATTTVASDITTGDLTVSVADGSLFAAGDVAMMTSTQDFSEVDSSYKRGELITVKSVSSNDLTLVAAAKEDYTTSGETVTVTLLSPVRNITINGLTIQGGGTNTHQYGLGVEYAVIVNVTDVHLTDCEDDGIAFGWCDRAIALACDVVNTNGSPTGAVPGYAFDFHNMTQDSGIVGCTARNFRHGFTTGSIYPVWNFSVSACHFTHGVGSGNAGVATHANGTQGSVGNGTTINDVDIGIEFDGPGCTANNTVITLARVEGILFNADGARDGHAIGNTIRGPIGIAVDGAAIASPDVSVVGNKLIGDAYGGTLGPGVSMSSANGKIIGNEIRAFSPGVVASEGYPTIEENQIIDVRTGAGNSYGIRIAPTTTVAGASIRRNRIYSVLASQMTDAVLLGSGTTDAIIESNDLNDWTNAPINDSGTRTRTKRNWINGERQRLAILGTTSAGIAAGASAGNIKTTNTITVSINGTAYTFSSSDPYWSTTASGCTTTGSEFRKALLCIATNGVGVIIPGVVAASQSAAVIPDWNPYNQIPVGFVQIPNSYTDGDSLAGFTFVDFLGEV